MFKIDQLRKENIIYATEAVAVAFVSELTYLFISLLSEEVPRYVAWLCMIVPVSFFIFMMTGNIQRHIKAKELEINLFR